MYSLKKTLVSSTLAGVLSLGMLPAMALADEPVQPYDGSQAVSMLSFDGVSVTQTGVYPNPTAFLKAFPQWTESMGSVEALGDTPVFYIEFAGTAENPDMTYMTVTEINGVQYASWTTGARINNYHFTYWTLSQAGGNIRYVNDGSGWKYYADGGVATPEISAGDTVKISLEATTENPSSGTFPASTETVMSTTLSVPAADSSSVASLYTANVGTTNNASVTLTAGDMTGASVSAAVGSTVVVNVTPDQGYDVTGVSVSNAGGYVKEATYENGVWSFVMPGYDVNVNVATAAQETPPAGYYFYDVPANAWYHDVVYEAADMGYMTGYRNGYFGPSDYITRQQIACVLFNMAGHSINGVPFEGTAHYSDVNTGDYGYQAIAWAQTTHVMNGYGNGVFGINDDATREQLMCTFMNYASYVSGKDLSLPEATVNQVLRAFPDGDKVSGYAREAAAWCVLNGVIDGVDNNGTRYLQPLSSITRAEVAAMAVRYQPGGML